MIDTTTPIGAEELRALESLHKQLPALSHIPFAEILTTPYLIKPLRRTLAAQKRAAAGFHLTPPPAPGAIPGSAHSSSSNSERRAVAVSPRRPHAWDERR